MAANPSWIVDRRSCRNGQRPNLCVTAFLLLTALGVLHAPGPASAQVGGIYIDAKGVVRDAGVLDENERLKALKISIEAPRLDAEISTASKMRKVSLRRLEEAESERQRSGQPISADAANLAGLIQLTHLIFDSDAQDVILAGPAEGWTTAPTGESVGVQSRRPVLQLDDLIQALRFTMSQQPRSAFIGVSIEPTAEGMQRYAAYMKSLGGQMDRSRLSQIFGGMEEAMGAQAVKLYGMPDTSRFALKMLAADYRLKRLALGHDASPVPDVVNYLDLHAKKLNPSAPQRQHRWWFVAEYDALRHTADRSIWEFEGQGVKVQTAPTNPEKPVSASGKPSKSKAEKEPAASPSATQFAQLATRHFPKLAERIPIFAELQNLVAIGVAAELMAERRRTEPRANVVGNRHDKDGLFAHFLDEKSCPTMETTVPQSVPSMTSYRLVDNRHWLISISGGVQFSVRDATRVDRRKEMSPRAQQELRLLRSIPKDATRWWWD